MRNETRTNSTTNTAPLTLLPLTPTQALRFTNDLTSDPNTANLMPNQLHDKKKLIQEFDNDKQNESDIGEINENNMSKKLPSRILIHMDSTRTLSNH
jgi:hypothetical protein